MVTPLSVSFNTGNSNCRRPARIIVAHQLYIKSVKYGYYTGTERASRKTEREYVDFVYPQEESTDKEEATRAFREKKEPHFTGK